MLLPPPLRNSHRILRPLNSIRIVSITAQQEDVIALAEARYKRPLPAAVTAQRRPDQVAAVVQDIDERWVRRAAVPGQERAGFPQVVPALR